MKPAAARPTGGNGVAVVIGIGAMLLGAVIWAAVTALTQHEFSLVAIGVGALIGLSMFVARPTSRGIALVAALLTIVGCALGDFLAIGALIAHQNGASFWNVLNAEIGHPKAVFSALGGKTYLFWAIGAAAAFSMTTRRIVAARTMSGPPVGPAPYAPYGQAPGGPPYGQAPGGPAYGQQPQPPQGQPSGQPGQSPQQQPGHGQQYPPG